MYPCFRSAPVIGGMLVVLLVGAMGGCASDSSSSSDAASTSGPRIYVGTGNDNPDSGIYTYRLDSSSGALTRTQDVTPILNPTFLALSQKEEHLYSVRETVDSAAVAAFDVEASTGRLQQINTVSAEGGAPCFISLDQTGQWALIANYVGGNVALFPVRANGGLGPASQVVQHTGAGADPDRQAAPHAHSFQVDPQNQYALAADLGIDEVRIYPFDADTGRLDTTSVRVVSTPPGTGPRHLDFHPNGEYVYLIGELSGTVIVYEYDAEEGRMTAVQTVSTVPDDFEGNAASADIHVHPSGNFLYASNRGDANDIVHYTIDETTGRLSKAGRQQQAVRWPRNFAIGPRGEFLVVANRRADAVTVYRIDADTGVLTYTGQSAEVPEPTKIEFATDPGS
ncbi:lactonase family protein [Salinibacter sp. 10B]|uniref:lactonase family protein n=1 Tax=Salinibacter sp. 10B TaxID=1923971 RepID=UPI000CF5328D|nr:lactonase family protein [Salinibacter sp. 10B]